MPPRLPVLVIDKPPVQAVRKSALEEKRNRELLNQWVEAHRCVQELKEDLVLALEIETELRMKCFSIMAGPEINFSKRQREVLVCIGKHLSNKEISAELNISVRTVKFHVQNILQKTKTHNRLELASVPLEILK